MYIPVFATYGCMLSFHIEGIAMSVDLDLHHQKYWLVIYDPIFVLFGRIIKCMYMYVPLSPGFSLTFHFLHEIGYFIYLLIKLIFITIPPSAFLFEF